MKRITDPAKLAAALQMVPYVPGGASWAGIDCWGANELWYFNRHGIELHDRMEIGPGPAGLSHGVAMHDAGWIEIPLDEGPRDDDTIIMRAVVTGDDGKRHVVEHGHCGVYTMGKLLHASGREVRGDDDEAHWVGACQFEDFDSQKIRGRVSLILRRVELA